MSDAILSVVMRWLHITGAAVVVGSLLFIVVCAGPARVWLGREDDFAVVKRIERRLRGLLAVAIVGLVVAGLYNWMLLAGLYELAGARVYVLLGIKVGLAAILIAVLWAQDVGLMVADRARWWRAVCLVLALVVVLLGAVVRHVRLAAVAAELAGR